MNSPAFFVDWPLDEMSDIETIFSHVYVNPVIMGWASAAWNSWSEEKELMRENYITTARVFYA